MAAPAEEVPAEMLAPKGWTKKFTPQRKGRSKIVFVSPTTEEIKNKSELSRYLKAHPGGPASSEFFWGIGDTLRRSSRITGKVKASDIPEGEKIPRRSRNPSRTKGKQEKIEDTDGEETNDTEAGKEKEAPGAEDAHNVGAGKVEEASEAEVTHDKAGRKGVDLEIKPTGEAIESPVKDAEKEEDKVNAPAAPEPVEDKKEDAKPAASDVAPPTPVEVEKKGEVAPSEPTADVTPASETKEDAAPVENAADNEDGQQGSQRTDTTKESSAGTNNGQLPPGSSEAP